MAKLVPCRSCGQTVASDARSCPGCGTPKPAPRNRLAPAIAIGIGVVVLGQVCSSPTKGPAPEAATASTAVPSHSDSSPPASPGARVEPASKQVVSAENQRRQPKRERLIKKLIAEGILYKTEMTEHVPQVYVAPAFYDLSIDDKQSFLGVVHAYYQTKDSKAEALFLYDARSGKEIGTYEPVLGLSLQ